MDLTWFLNQAVKRNPLIVIHNYKGNSLTVIKSVFERIFMDSFWAKKLLSPVFSRVYSGSSWEGKRCSWGSPAPGKNHWTSQGPQLLLGLVGVFCTVTFSLYLSSCRFHRSQKDCSEGNSTGASRGGRRGEAHADQPVNRDWGKEETVGRGFLPGRRQSHAHKWGAVRDTVCPLALGLHGHLERSLSHRWTHRCDSRT